jgi:hypothetical protein
MRRRAFSCALPLGFSMKYTPELYFSHGYFDRNRVDVGAVCLGQNDDARLDAGNR